MADELEARLHALAQRLGLDPEQRERLHTLAQQEDPAVSIVDVATLSQPSHVPTPVLDPAGLPGEGSDLAERLGPFRVLARLGVGGMGEVLRVLDPNLGRPMALKVLRGRRSHLDSARSRFLAEARATARLQHPGIVPIHALGALPDGRLWYTMEEVRGRTLRDVLLDLHVASREANGWTRTRDGWTLRRLIDALHRASQAVAYAHAMGVIHRDIKPANIMVGAFGEVRVLDWGVAKLLDLAELALGPITGDGEGAPLETRAGAAVGTPAYMAPEQARGELDQVGPWTDVYALGITLYQVLCGELPPWCAGRLILAGRPLVEPSPPQGPGAVPQELVEIMRKAVQPEIELRYGDATAMAEDLGAWLEGAQRRERALELVGRADQQRPQAHQARERARALRAAAEATLGHVPSHAPIDVKRPVWKQEDEARRQERAARQIELEYEQLLRQALELSPALPEADDRLADMHLERHARAEAEGDGERALQEEAHLRLHGPRRHARYLSGEGALTLVTEPPGASVRLFRYIEEDRRLVPELVEELGPTPIFEHSLPPGSYLCEIEAPGRDPVPYPIFLRRREHWDGVPPGGQTPLPIALPPADLLGPDDIYVPAGWFWSGARDGTKRDSLPWRRLWQGPLVIRRCPVTNREFMDFLDDLVAQGREEEALRWAPRYQGSVDDSTSASRR